MTYQSEMSDKDVSDSITIKRLHPRQSYIGWVVGFGEFR